MEGNSDMRNLDQSLNTKCKVDCMADCKADEIPCNTVMRKKQEKKDYIDHGCDDVISDTCLLLSKTFDHGICNDVAI